RPHATDATISGSRSPRGPPLLRASEASYPAIRATWRIFHFPKIRPPSPTVTGRCGQTANQARADRPHRTRAPGGEVDRRLRAEADLRRARLQRGGFLSTGGSLSFSSPCSASSASSCSAPASADTVPSMLKRARPCIGLRFAAHGGQDLLPHDSDLG